MDDQETIAGVFFKAVTSAQWSIIDKKPVVMAWTLSKLIDYLKKRGLKEWEWERFLEILEERAMKFFTENIIIEGGPYVSIERVRLPAQLLNAFNDPTEDTLQTLADDISFTPVERENSKKEDS